jgi:hypothetical protein
VLVNKALIAGGVGNLAWRLVTNISYTFCIQVIFMCKCCSQGEMSYGYITSLGVEAKCIYCVNKDISKIWNETASYKLLPLRNNVESMDSIWCLICFPFHPLWSLCLLLLISRAHRCAPTTARKRFFTCKGIISVVEGWSLLVSGYYLQDKVVNDVMFFWICIPYLRMSSDIKDSCYENVECIFDQFPSYHTKILQLFEELESAFYHFCVIWKC